MLRLRYAGYRIRRRLDWRGLEAVPIGMVALAMGTWLSLTVPPAGASVADAGPGSLEPANEAVRIVQDVQEAAARTLEGLETEAVGGEPSERQVADVRAICHDGWDDLYRERMEGYGVGRDDYQTQCVSDLLAIAWAESRYDCSAVGDGGYSLGCYQIHRKWHPEISDPDRLDFGFSTAWTLGRLIGNGWPKYRTTAIRKHNGWGPATIAYASAVKWKANQIIKQD
jgi:hypothetical protein